MTTNYLIRLEFKFHNVVAWLYWSFLKAHNSFRSWYSLLQSTYFEISVNKAVHTNTIGDVELHDKE